MQSYGYINSENKCAEKPFISYIYADTYIVCEQ